jgi:hypothetical protein
MSSGRLSRAVFLKAAVGLAGAALAASSSTAARAQRAVMQARVTLGGAQASQWMVYVGCYTTPDRFGHGHGISVYRMDAATGDWTAVQVLERWLAHADRPGDRDGQSGEHRLRGSLGSESV